MQQFHLVDVLCSLAHTGKHTHTHTHTHSCTCAVTKVRQGWAKWPSTALVSHGTESESVTGHRP